MNDFEKLPEHNIVWVQKWTAVRHKNFDLYSNRLNYITIHLHHPNNTKYAYLNYEHLDTPTQYYASFALYRDILKSRYKYIQFDTLEWCIEYKLLSIIKN